MPNASLTADQPGPAVFARASSGMYATIVAVFASLLFMANIAATKGVEFGPIVGDFSIITDGGFFLIPLAYILGDVLAEVYGLKAARRAILIGFGVAILAAVSFWIVTLLPPASFYEGQESLEAVVGVYPQILVASLTAFLLGQLFNSYVLVRIKERTKERHLWARLMGSSVVGQFTDTLIFCAIAATAIGISTMDDFLNYLFFGFVYKTAVEAILLPVTYQVVALVKKREPTYAIAEQA
ncbi:queuosine precursor transporter [Lolliginicoccus suaedae]|uniref:queuosine precursor transporter n=1 Tax=Lolliginicoccus suaedae TaxID=2605429 RepID=UPI0011EE2395|nr:queuosine precursor transporter [Lolliginicoccus suaedae]